MTLDKLMFMLPGLIIGITVHEFAHAWMASMLGDNYARRQGRVSLNPLRHLSPLGTLTILFLPFGWGRPVPVNLYNFRKPRRDSLLISLAGPVANLIVVLVCLGLMQLTRYDLGPGGWFLQWAHYVIGLVAFMNAVLALINLIPIPPLDGSKIWPVLFRNSSLVAKGKRSWIPLALLAVLLWTNALDPLAKGVVNNLSRVMPLSGTQVVNRKLEQGWKAVENEEYAKAELLASEAIRVDPNTAEGFYLRCVSRWELGNLSGALADANHAVQLCPDNPEYAKLLKDVQDAVKNLAD